MKKVATLFDDHGIDILVLLDDSKNRIVLLAEGWFAFEYVKTDAGWNVSFADEPESPVAETGVLFEPDAERTAMFLIKAIAGIYWPSAYLGTRERVEWMEEHVFEPAEALFNSISDANEDTVPEQTMAAADALQVIGEGRDMYREAIGALRRGQL